MPRAASPAMQGRLPRRPPGRPPVRPRPRVRRRPWSGGVGAWRRPWPSSPARAGADRRTLYLWPSHLPSGASMTDRPEAAGRADARFAERMGGEPATTRADASDGADVLGLLALAARGDVELDPLALFEGAVARALDVGEMHEDVFAVLTGDEAVALLRVEELHGTGRQFPVSLLFTEPGWLAHLLTH